MIESSPPTVAGKLAPVALALWGAGVTLWYGRVGFHPLDHSIVFDGAWRLLCGQLPFRDFDTPFALTPMLMQVPFFATFGVSWLAACLHAAAVNGAFAAIVYLLLQAWGSSVATSSAYAALAALMLYPPAGLPCHDQHAYFFSFVAVVAALLASREVTTRERAWAALSGVTLVLAYFSKQNPTVFALPVVAGALLLVKSGSRRRVWGGAALGLLGSLALLSVIALGLRLDPRRFHEDYHRRPALEARRRTAGDATLPRLASSLGALVVRLRFVTLPVVPVAALAILATSRVARRRPELRAALVVAAALPLVGLVAAHITYNDPEESLAFVLPSLGLVDAVLGAMLAGSSRRRGIAGLRALLLLLAVQDGARFHARVNVTRSAVAPELSGDAGSARLPDALAFMTWRLPEQYRFTAEDFTGVLEFLRREPGRFWLMGDATVLYALAGKPSVGPCMTLFPGLSMPHPGTRSPEFLAFEGQLVEDFPRKDVRFIVLEGKGSWFEVRLKDFRRLHRALASEPMREWHFGAFTVLELPEGLRRGILPPRARYPSR